MAAMASQFLFRTKKIDNRIYNSKPYPDPDPNLKLISTPGHSPPDNFRADITQEISPYILSENFPRKFHPQNNFLDICRTILP